MRILILMLAISAFLACTSEPEETGLNQVSKKNSLQNLDSGWTQLSLREQIGQTMLMLPERENELALGNGSLDRFFDRYPVGGFFMGWKLFSGVAPKDYLEHQLQATKEYAASSKIPLLFQQDYENGLGETFPELTLFPREMNLGAANDTSLANQFGEAVARECRHLGVNWVLHPVADLNINRYNPITSLRSIGDNPDMAIQLLSSQIKGLQENGVAATIKHFPGDGVDVRDQHLVTTSNFLSKEAWWENHGRVFQELINEGVYCIMPGHIRLPFYQKEKINGFMPPATLSKELLTDLLKKEMGFNGVIISDAMVMGGFRGYYPTNLENEIKSFEFGVDMMLWPSYAYMDTLEARILRNEIPLERLHDAVHRVWNLKKRLGLFDKNYPQFESIDEETIQKHKNLAREIGKASLTQLTGKGAFLAKSKDQTIALIYVTPISNKGGDRLLNSLKSMKDLLESEGFEVHDQHNLLYENQGWSQTLTEKYDKVIFLVARQQHQPFGPLQFYDDEAQSIWAINAMPKEKLAVINFGDPYAYTEYFERVPYFINAYSDPVFVQEAVVDVLMGRQQATGESPVNLDFISSFNFE